MPFNPDTLPTASDPNGECPRCGRISNFNTIFNHDLVTIALPNQMGRAIEKVAALQCMGCAKQTVVIEAEINDQYGLQGVYWWPAHDLGLTADAPGVPQDVVDAYGEGVRCITVHAPNAAAAMFRTTLAHIVMDKGSPAAHAENTLFAKINRMSAEGALWNEFGDAAHYIRVLGNAGAHGEGFQPVTQEQATDLQNFIKELINFIYIQPFRRNSALAPTRRAAETPLPDSTGAEPNEGGLQ